MKISSKEVSDQLKRAVAGEVPVRLVHDETWDECYAGNVEFFVGDWRITIFNDCDSLDYVDSAIAPDGRTGDFDDWWGEENGHDPLRSFALRPSEDLALEKLLKSARQSPDEAPNDPSKVQP